MLFHPQNEEYDEIISVTKQLQRQFAPSLPALHPHAYLSHTRTLIFLFYLQNEEYEEIISVTDQLQRQFAPTLIPLHPHAYLSHTRTLMFLFYLQNEEYEEIISVTDQLQRQFAPYFDHALVNDDLQRAVNELSLAAHNLETEPMWVPADWVR